jgi:RHS repeat-associated protein
VTTNSSGAVTQTLDYYPYGSQRIATGSFAEQRRFIGEELDGDTEFSYLNARYYQGSRGQFMSQDPVFLTVGTAHHRALTGLELAGYLSDPQGMNSYGYSRNNPLRLIDPDGAWAQDYVSGRQSFGEFRSQALNAQLELGNAAQQLTQDSRAWDFAVSHPVVTGMVIVGPLSGAAAASGVQAYAAFHAATYPGVGAAYAAKHTAAGFVYSILGINSGLAIRDSTRSLAGADLTKPSSYYSTIKTIGVNVVPQMIGGYAGAIADVSQFPKRLGNRYKRCRKSVGGRQRHG